MCLSNALTMSLCPELNEIHCVLLLLLLLLCIVVLSRCVLKQSMLKQFALQMACDFAHASSVVRSLMWDEGLLDFYLSVMRSPQDRHWHVTIFGSLCAW